MDKSFAADVASWQSAYVLIGGMAATLTGLLFVAVSINLRTVMSRANPDLRHSAIRTFNQFVLIMELAIVYQIPDQNPVTLGVSIMVLSVVALGIIVVATRESGVGRTVGRGDSWLSYALFLAFALVGALITTGQFELLFVMVSLVIGTLISAVFSAWQLMVEVGQDDDSAPDPAAGSGRSGGAVS